MSALIKEYVLDGQAMCVVGQGCSTLEGKDELQPGTVVVLPVNLEVGPRVLLGVSNEDGDIKGTVLNADQTHALMDALKNAGKICSMMHVDDAYAPAHEGTVQ